MSGYQVIMRRAARVLVVDAAGRVLMLRSSDPVRPEHRYWVTVGGGVEGDESLATAAARELAEETGLRVSAAALGQPVWQETTEFPFDGRHYRQEQVYFLLRVDSWQVDTAGFDDVERATVDAHRWWTPGELIGAGEPYYPAQLPDLLRRLGVA